MNDVFDEELMKELGLEPGDLQAPKPEKKRRPARRPSSAAGSAEAGQVKPPVKTARPSPKGAKPKEPPIQKEPVPEPQAVEKPQPRKAPPQELPTEDEEIASHSRNVSKEIPVQLAAVLAKKTLRLKDILEMKTGEVLDFKKMPQEPLDLVANGKLIAKAELVMIDGRIGARIVKLVK